MSNQSLNFMVTFQQKLALMNEEVALESLIG